MTGAHASISYLKTHIKKFLNEVDKYDKLLKLLTNDKNETQKWLSQSEHLHLFGLIKNIRFQNDLLRLWEGKELGEKFNQAFNKKLVSIKGYWASSILENLIRNKLLASFGSDNDTKVSHKSIDNCIKKM